VVHFIRKHIIDWDGVPRYINTNNGKPFINKLRTSLYEKFKFSKHKSLIYKAPINALEKAFNKTFYNLLKKVVSKSNGDFHKKLGEVLCVYQTSYRMPTQLTPYALVYDVEVVLPLKFKSYRCTVPYKKGSMGMEVSNSD